MDRYQHVYQCKHVHVALHYGSFHSQLKRIGKATSSDNYAILDSLSYALYMQLHGFAEQSI